MINRKNVLGKIPDELGIKDAIHTAIVSVRAAHRITPGAKCKLNEFNEAISCSKDELGVADPFISDIQTGQNFWLILKQDAVPNVQHVWEHPDVSFDKPTRDIVRNKYLLSIAQKLSISYEELMRACNYVVYHDTCLEYTGPGNIDKIDLYTLWSEWSEETGYEFENYGSVCCPEYKYPKKLYESKVND